MIAHNPEYSPSLVFGCFGIVKGVAAIVGPVIATKLHRPELIQIPITGNPKGFGGYGFTTVTLFVGGMMVATTAGSLLSLGIKRWVDMLR